MMKIKHLYQRNNKNSFLMNTIMSQKSANTKADLFHFGTIYKVKFMGKKIQSIP